MDYVEENKRFPYVTYSETKAKYTSTGFYSPGASTFGFYQLRNTLCTTEVKPVNMYLFVSDANAPLPLYDVDTSSWSDA